MDLQSIVTILASLTGLGGAFSLLVNIAKMFGWVKDGQSEVVYTGLGIIGLAIVWVVQFFVPSFFPNVPFVNLPQLDAFLAGVVKVGSAILEFLVLNKAGTLLYSKVRGVVPLLGYSFSDKKFSK